MTTIIRLERYDNHGHLGPCIFSFQPWSAFHQCTASATSPSSYFRGYVNIRVGLPRLLDPQIAAMPAALVLTPTSRTYLFLALEGDPNAGRPPMLLLRHACLIINLMCSTIAVRISNVCLGFKLNYKKQHDSDMVDIGITTILYLHSSWYIETSISVFIFSK